MYNHTLQGWTEEDMYAEIGECFSYVTKTGTELTLEEYEALRFTLGIIALSQVEGATEAVKESALATSEEIRIRWDTLQCGAHSVPIERHFVQEDETLTEETKINPDYHYDWCDDREELTALPNGSFFCESCHFHNTDEAW